MEKKLMRNEHRNSNRMTRILYYEYDLFIFMIFQILLSLSIFKFGRC